MWEHCYRCWTELSGWSGLREPGGPGPVHSVSHCCPKWPLRYFKEIWGSTEHSLRSAAQPTSYSWSRGYFVPSLLFQCSLPEAACLFNLGIMFWPRNKLRAYTMSGIMGASVRPYTTGNGESFGMTPPVSVSTMEMMRSTSGNPTISWSTTLR